MILLSAIPDEWDHVAAYYMQTCTSVVNVSFDVIRKAILAEFDHSGGSCPDQSHVVDKISAIKWKGKAPKFSKQKGADSSSANNDDGPSSSKKRHDHKKAKKAQGNSHHQSHVASMAMMVNQSAKVQPSATVSRPMIALQPSQAGPSTMTVASFRPQGITYESKSLKQSAQAYTGQTGQPGPSTLTENQALISCLNLNPTIETMKSVESLCNHQQFVESLMAYRDAIAGEKPSFPPLPLQSRIEEIPKLVAHMPPTGKHPKKMPIMTVGLPTRKKDKGKKKVISPSVVNSSGDEALDWGSDDGRLYDALDEDIAESAGLKQQRPLTPNAFYDTDDGMDIVGDTRYDHISPQVPFHSFGIIGSLIVEQQGQFCNGLVDSSNISLSANCTNCKKCKSSDPIGVVKNLVRRAPLKKGEIEFIGDLGASVTFTNDLNDFFEYKELDKIFEA